MTVRAVKARKFKRKVLILRNIPNIYNVMPLENIFKLIKYSERLLELKK